MVGPGWFALQYSGKKPTSLTINPNVTSDVYISKGADSDPNNFVYDMKLTNVTSKMTIDSDELGLTSDEGYALAVYVNAINEANNTVLYAHVDLSLDDGVSALSLAASVIAIGVSLLA